MLGCSECSLLVSLVVLLIVLYIPVFRRAKFQSKLGHVQTSVKGVGLVTSAFCSLAHKLG